MFVLIRTILIDEFYILREDQKSLPKYSIHKLITEQLFLLK